MSSVLDLHDSTLRLWHRDELVESPGYAWWDGQHFRFGVPAMRTQRRTPREVNTRYWSQLSTQPLSPPLGQARHAADLVHAHLQDMHRLAGEPSDLLITAPGSMGREALSLLLGIVEHLPFRVAGLVHRTAVLGAASGLSRGQHVELQLHQTQVTPFVVDGQQVTVETGQVIPGEGMLALQDRLATAIAGSFVAQTRFDPLRSADGEQSLYDALPGALESLRSVGEAQIAIGGYQARITRDDLQSVGAAYGRVIAPLLSGDAPILLESPLDLLPGLVLPAAHHNTSGQRLAAVVSECASALLQTADQLTLNRSVPVVTSGGMESSTEITQQAPASAAADHRDITPPTHLLLGSSAIPLESANDALPEAASVAIEATAARLTLGEASDLQVNGQPAENGQVLCPGDELSDASGYRALLIVVGD